MDRDHGPTRPRPRVLITGAGEPRVDELCAALSRRAIDSIVIEGALDDAIRAERPNLVLLVGEAASDDGARAIDDARRAGSTPIVVATDPEPLDRRLAPFALGASGVLVRRGDPNEMAGELQHLIAENARRIAESADDRAPEELHGLLGMSAREILSRATPIEGVPRYDPIAPPGSGSWTLDPPIDEVPTLEIPGLAPGQPLAAPLPDWDDLTTKRQPAPDVARWRRLSAADRSAMTTPPQRAALDATGAPRTPRAVSEDLDLVAAMEAETRPAIVAPPDGIAELAPASRAARVSSIPPPRPTPRSTPPPRPSPAPRSSPPPARTSAPPPGPAGVPPQLRGIAETGAEASLPATHPELPAVAPSASEPISASVLVAPAPPRPSISDRASTLRARAMPRPRASATPALVGLALVIAAIALIAGPHVIDAARDLARDAAEADAASREASGPGAPVSTSATVGASPTVGASAPVVATAARGGASAPVAVAAARSAGTPDTVRTSPTPRASEAGAATTAVTPTTATPVPATPVPADPVSATPVSATEPAPIDALVREARAFARRGDRARALALLEQAVELDPNDPHAAIALAEHHLTDRRAGDAVTFAQRAVSLRRRRPDYHVVLGDAYQLAGDAGRARAAWESALALDPEHAAARARLDR